MILPMPRKGRTERQPLAHGAQCLRRHRSDRGDVVKRRRAMIERGKAGRQIEHLAVQNQAGLFAGCGAVTDKLHGLYNIRGSCKTANQYETSEERLTS